MLNLLVSIPILSLMLSFSCVKKAEEIVKDDPLGENADPDTSADSPNSNTTATQAVTRTVVSSTFETDGTKFSFQLGIIPEDAVITIEAATAPEELLSQNNIFGCWHIKVQDVFGNDIVIERISAIVLSMTIVDPITDEGFINLVRFANDASSIIDISGINTDDTRRQVTFSTNLISGVYVLLAKKTEASSNLATEIVNTSAAPISVVSVPPTATITRSAGQLNPVAYGETISYDLRFSKDIRGLTSSDITSAFGALSASYTVLPTADLKIFTITLTAPSEIGILKPVLASGTVEDLEGHANVSAADNSAAAITNLSILPLASFQLSMAPSVTQFSSNDVTLIAKNSRNATMAGYTGTVSFSSTDPGANFAQAKYTFNVGDSGVHTFSSLYLASTSGSAGITISDADAAISGTVNITVNAWSPSSISNLTLWLDAGDITSMFTDSTCSNSVTSNGEAVACWKNKEGTASRNATDLGGSGALPTYTTGVLGGKGVLYFDGSTSYLGSSASTPISAGNNNYAIVSVWRSRDSNRGCQAIFDQHAGTNTDNTRAALLAHCGGQNYYGFNGQNNNDQLLAPSTSNTWSFTVMNRRTGESNTAPNFDTEIYSLGGRWASNVVNNAIANVGSAAYQVGRGVHANATAEYLYGDIAETLVYNKTLSPDEIGNLQNYLATKWGGIGFARSISGISMGSGNGQVEGPTALAIHPRTGEIYVGDCTLTNKRILVLTPDLAFIRSIPLGFACRGIAFDALGNLLITDTQNQLLRKLDTQGTLSTLFSSFSNIHDLAIKDNILYLDDFNVGIDKYARLDGNFPWALSAPSFITQIHGHSIALDSSGNIFETGWTDNVVRKFSSSGVLLSANFLVGGCSTCTGIEVMNSGDILVLKTWNANASPIKRYASSGVYRDQYDASATSRHGFYHVKSIGRVIYVTDFFNKLVIKIYLY